MKRCYNYTGRVGLSNSDAEIKLIDNKDSLFFSLSFKADKLKKFTPSATIIVEPYLSRICFPQEVGTLGKPPKPSETFPIPYFQPGTPLKFRLKVIDTNCPKRTILAWRDRIQPIDLDTTGSKKKSVLPVYPKDLGEVAWQLNWDEPAHPYLEINNKISDARNITAITQNDPDFAALVFPEVLSQILYKLILDDNLETDESEVSWERFVREIQRSPIPSIEESEESEIEVQEWVSDTVQKFSKRLSLIPNYMKFKQDA